MVHIRRAAHGRQHAVHHRESVVAVGIREPGRKHRGVIRKLASIISAKRRSWAVASLVFGVFFVPLS